MFSPHKSSKDDHGNRAYLIAKQITAAIFNQYASTRLRLIEPVPIEKIAAQWGLEQSATNPLDTGHGTSDDIRRSGGLIRGLENSPFFNNNEPKEMMTFPLPLEKPQYEMFIFGSGYKRRFTIAHELAHVVLNNQFLAEKERLTNNVEENVCDIAASMILLPDVKLVAAFANTKNVKLNISLLEDLSKKLEVSLTVMVNRIRETSRTRSIQLLNCAFIVDLAKSRKTSENLAPRVQASCLPIGWYMPNNKRLSSLEMQFLPNLFYQTTLYEKRQIYDHIRIWNQNSRCWSKIEGLVSLKCYITENKTRIMLATIDSQSFDVSL